MSARDLSIIEGFEWDEGNLKHIKRHKAQFSECEQIFFNIPLLLSEDKSHSQKEERWQALGQTNNHRLLFVVFTIRMHKIRVISARNQNKKERSKIRKLGGNIYEKV